MNNKNTIKKRSLSLLWGISFIIPALFFIILGIISPMNNEIVAKAVGAEAYKCRIYNLNMACKNGTSMKFGLFDSCKTCQDGSWIPNNTPSLCLNLFPWSNLGNCVTCTAPQGCSSDNVPLPLTDPPIIKTPSLPTSTYTSIPNKESTTPVNFSFSKNASAVLHGDTIDWTITFESTENTSNLHGNIHITLSNNLSFSPNQENDGAILYKTFTLGQDFPIHFSTKVTDNNPDIAIITADASLGSATKTATFFYKALAEETDNSTNNYLSLQDVVISPNPPVDGQELTITVRLQPQQDLPEGHFLVGASYLLDYNKIQKQSSKGFKVLTNGNPNTTTQRFTKNNLITFSLSFLFQNNPQEPIKNKINSISILYQDILGHPFTEIAIPLDFAPEPAITTPALELQNTLIAPTEPITTLDTDVTYVMKVTKTTNADKDVRINIQDALSPVLKAVSCSIKREQVETIDCNNLFAGYSDTFKKSTYEITVVARLDPQEIKDHYGTSEKLGFILAPNTFTVTTNKDKPDQIVYTKSSEEISVDLKCPEDILLGSLSGTIVCDGNHENDPQNAQIHCTNSPGAQGVMFTTEPNLQFVDPVTHTPITSDISIQCDNTKNTCVFTVDFINIPLSDANLHKVNTYGFTWRQNRNSGDNLDWTDAISTWPVDTENSSLTSTFTWCKANRLMWKNYPIRAQFFGSVSMQSSTSKQDSSPFGTSPLLSLAEASTIYTKSIPNASVEVVSSTGDRQTAETNYLGKFVIETPKPVKGARITITKKGYKTIVGTVGNLPEDAEYLVGDFEVEEGSEQDILDQSNKIQQITAENIPKTEPTPDYHQASTLMGGSIDITGMGTSKYIAFLLTWLYSIISGIGILSIMASGYIYTTANGNPLVLQQTRVKIYNTVIALLVVFTAWALTAFVGGMNLLQWTL